MALTVATFEEKVGELRRGDYFYSCSPRSLFGMPFLRFGAGVL